MAISETLINAVKDEDITTIRSCFYTIILSDPEFQSNRFNEALEYVKSCNVACLFDLHDGESLKPEEEWSEDYFDMLSSKLQDNFSEERIQQIKKVATQLKAENESNMKSERDTIIHSESTEASADNYSKYEKKNMNDSENKRVNYSSNKNDDYLLIGAIGVGIATFLVLHHIFRGGKK